MVPSACIRYNGSCGDITACTLLVATIGRTAGGVDADVGGGTGGGADGGKVGGAEAKVTAATDKALLAPILTDRNGRKELGDRADAFKILGDCVSVAIDGDGLMVEDGAVDGKDEIRGNAIFPSAVIDIGVDGRANWF